MNYEHASACARQQAINLLGTLDLGPDEREIVHDLYVSLMGAVNRNRAFWERLESGTIKPEVIPSAAAMFTAYTNELVRVLRETEDIARE